MSTAFKLPETRAAATIEDVAQVLGVSRTTVSKAFTGYGRMSEKTRAAVLQAAGELGYQPNVHAQRLANGHCRNTVGLFALSLDYGVGVRKLQAIQTQLAAMNYDVPMYAYADNGSGTSPDETALLRSLCLQRPQAIACCTTRLQAASLEELVRYHDNGGIVVSYDLPPKMDCDSVVFDRVENTQRATQHLLELGHRKLGFYNVHVIDPLRFEGFRRSLAEYGLEVHQDWLFTGGRDEDGGAILAEQFLNLSAKNRPTALCIVNDASAVAFVAEVTRAGLRVPEDVSVVGHDNLPISKYFTLSLTTASQPIDAIADNVAQLLSSRLNGSYSGPARKITVTGDLIVRDSAIVPPSPPN